MVLPYSTETYSDSLPSTANVPDGYALIFDGTEVKWDQSLPSTISASADDALTYTGSGLAWRSPSLNLFNYVQNATPSLIGQAISGDAADVQLKAVDISNDGTRIIVGSKYADAVLYVQNEYNITGTDTGYVEVYDRETAVNGGYVWNLSVRLTQGADANFGGSVAIAKDNKDRIVVGAPFYGQNTNTGPGIVWIYHYNGPTYGWTVLWQSDSSSPPVRTYDSARNGTRVAISDDGLVVAFSSLPPSGTTPYANLRGQVEVLRFADISDLDPTDMYSLNAGDWNISYPTVSDQFGTDLQLSANGNTLIVGANNLLQNGQERGGAFIYTYVTAGASSQYTEVVVRADLGQNFGKTVAISGDGSRIAIGLPNWQNGANFGAIYLYHFDVSTSSFVFNTYIQSSGSENLGASAMSLAFNQNGHRLVVGSPYYDISGYVNRGRVLVYEYNTQTSSWGQFFQILGEVETGHNFGSETSMTSDGKFIITSALGDDNVNGTDAGVVKIYGLPDALTSGSLYYSSDNIIRILP
jgi:hypothetical protein